MRHNLDYRTSFMTVAQAVMLIAAALTPVWPDMSAADGGTFDQTYQLTTQQRR